MIVVGFWGPSEWEGWQQPDLNGDLSLPMLTILYILFCNVLHCLSRITIFYILFCNVLHCFCRIAILYILFCNFLHCLCRIAILYILFSMLLIFTPPKVDNMPPKVNNLALALSWEARGAWLVSALLSTTETVFLSPCAVNCVS